MITGRKKGLCHIFSPAENVPIIWFDRLQLQGNTGRWQHSLTYRSPSCLPTLLFYLSSSDRHLSHISQWSAWPSWDRRTGRESHLTSGHAGSVKQNTNAVIPRFIICSNFPAQIEFSANTSCTDTHNRGKLITVCLNSQFVMPGRIYWTQEDYKIVFSSLTI